MVVIVVSMGSERVVCTGREPALEPGRFLGLRF